jgi:2-dehydropantoate 2-reductase
MHLAIVGAGALGLVFGGRLALHGGIESTLIVRPHRASDDSPVILERVDGAQEHEVWRPERFAALPDHADVIMVCVRYEQVNDELFALLRGSEAPVVMMTPMMPTTYQRAKKVLGDRLLAGMPGVVSYVNEAGAVRYWLPRTAPVLVEEPRPRVPVVDELIAGLVKAGMKARLEMGVHETNPATTVIFAPLMMALDAAGSIDALIHDREILDLGLKAADEAVKLSERIGKAAPFTPLLLKFVGPLTLKAGIALGRARSPEAVHYVEEHFGHKLRAQHISMAEDIVALATEKGTPHEAIDGLLQRLRGASVTAG